MKSSGWTTCELPSSDYCTAFHIDISSGVELLLPLLKGAASFGRTHSADTNVSTFQAEYGSGVAKG